jgi:hypothetical protein
MGVFRRGYWKDLATEIQEYYISDFSHWKDHDAFEEAFSRLLRDLKADDLKVNARNTIDRYETHCDARIDVSCTFATSTPHVRPPLQQKMAGVV